jgi:hypothetical protein
VKVILLVSNSGHLGKGYTVEYQNVILNGDTPSGWTAYIYKPFHHQVAPGME